MTLVEKRNAIRDARNRGLIPSDRITGLGIAKLDNDTADAMLAEFNLSSEPSDAPSASAASSVQSSPERQAAPSMPASAPVQAAPSDPLAAAIAAAIAPMMQGTVSQADFDALAEKSEALERRLAEIDGGKKITVFNPANGKTVQCGKQHHQFEDLLSIVACRLNAYLPGPAGSGKTSAAESVAKALELEFSSISVCGQTTVSSLLGYMDATGNYVSTEFRKRYETGGVFCLDEIDAGNPNVIAVLNSALANGACAFPDGMVKRHADFVLIATANTVGNGANAQYIGRNPLDAATVDRFAMLDWQYDKELELSFSSNEKWTKRVQALRAAASALNSRHIISPRASINGAKLLATGMEQDKVETLVVWKGIQESERQKIESKAREMASAQAIA